MEYVAEAAHQQGMQFRVSAHGHEIQTDYPMGADEEGIGQRPLELLLSSLATCAGGALAVLLRKGGQRFTGLTVRATGQRRQEHPTVFTSLALEFVVRGPVDRAAVAAALEQSEARICPVWAMLKPGTPISSSFTIES